MNNYRQFQNNAQQKIQVQQNNEENTKVTEFVQKY